MKKLFALLLAAVMVLSMAACGKKEAEFTGKEVLAPIAAEDFSMYRNRTHAHTGQRHGRVSLTVINAMVNARFQWLNRDIVKMYSSLGLGAMTAFGLVKESFFFYDATWVGLAVGEKVYGYFEFGGGASGVARAGLGVRF